MGKIKLKINKPYPTLGQRTFDYKSKDLFMIYPEKTLWRIRDLIRMGHIEDYYQDHNDGRVTLKFLFRIPT